MARKSKKKINLFDQDINTEDSWDMKSALMFHALMAIFQQSYWKDIDTNPNGTAYHADVVETLRAYFAKRPDKEVERLVDKTWESYHKWYNTYLPDYIDNIPNVETGRYLVFTRLILNYTYPPMWDPDDNVGSINDISVDEDGFVHGENVEEVLKTNDYLWNSRFKGEVEKMLEEETDEDDKETDEDEDLESESEFFEKSYDWPMPHRVILLYLAYKAALRLKDRFPGIYEAKDLCLAAQKAIRTYMKPASARQREIAIDRASDSLFNLLDYLDNEYYHGNLKSLDLHNVTYMTIYCACINVEDMDDEEVKDELRSLHYDKEYKVYQSDSLDDFFYEMVDNATCSISTEEDDDKNDQKVNLLPIDVQDIIKDLKDRGDISAMEDLPKSFIKVCNTRLVSNDPQHFYAQKMDEFWDVINSHEEDLVISDLAALTMNIMDWAWLAVKAKENNDSKTALEILLGVITHYSYGISSNERLVKSATTHGCGPDSFWDLLSNTMHSSLLMLIFYLHDEDFDTLNRVRDELRELAPKLSKTGHKMLEFDGFWKYYEERQNDEYNKHTLWD